MDDLATLTLDHDSVLTIMAMLREREREASCPRDRADASSVLDAVERAYYGHRSMRPIPAT